MEMIGKRDSEKHNREEGVATSLVILHQQWGSKVVAVKKRMYLLVGVRTGRVMETSHQC